MIDIHNLKRRIIGLGFSNFVNIFLFGISGKDVFRLTGQYQWSGTEMLSEENDSPVKTCPDYSGIRKRIGEWLASGNHFISNFSLSDLSEAIDIPKKYLAMYFERYLRQDFRSWKSNLRIEKAKSLLLEDLANEDLGSIALAVGFRDKSNFHRQFKMRTGCTPMEWRQTNGHPDMVD